MLTIYFSGTGNTAFVAQNFSEKIGATCINIEDDADFAALFAAHDKIAVFYPVYGSRVPLIMRRFSNKYEAYFAGKKVVIIVTQMLFSGDGARVFTDLFPPGHFDVIYAEHLMMPNNVSNFVILPKTSDKRVKKHFKRAENKINAICDNINKKVVKLRGFSRASKLLGSVQGKAWQGANSNIEPSKRSMEHKAKSSVRVAKHCTTCGLCVKECPMNNLEINENSLLHKNNCTVCYRCVNLCPQRSVTVFFHNMPRWQYKGLRRK